MANLGENVRKNDHNCTHCHTKLFHANNFCYKCGYNNQTNLFEFDKALNHAAITHATGEVDEMNVTPMPSGFDVNYFKALKSFNKRIQYCNQTLQKIKSGSGRVVYVVDNAKVLKLAKNEKGLEQNRLEADYLIQEHHLDVVTQVYEYDQDDMWLISEFAKNTSVKKFEQTTGVNFEKLCEFLRTENRNFRKGWGKTLSQEEIDAMYDNEYVMQILSVMQDFDMPAGDLCRIGSYGEVVRNGRPAIVLRDYGLSQDIYDRLYNKAR